MADSFFGFDTSLERDNLDDGVNSDDEEDYDALNDETFGGDAILDGDWEKDHEKLAEITEYSRHHKDIININENGDLSAKIAAFILDDDPDPHEEEIEKVDFTHSRPARPPPGFTNVTCNHHPPDVPIRLSNVKKMCTVEEIERNLIKPSKPSLLEDIERNLIANQHQLISLPPHPAFISLPGRHHPLLNNHIPKLPALPAPFPLPRPFPHPFAAIHSGALRVTQPPPPLLRLTPMRSPPLIPPPPRLPPLMPPVDEYAGLMTPKEKQWLAQIQLMQLSSNNPFQEDYYYLMYQHRQSGIHGRKGNIKLSRDTPTPCKSYTPLQFENSLGKLQVGSVMAPRKIIDTDVVEIVDCHVSSTSSKKFKQILLEIEHLFSSILLAEEVISPLATSSLENVNPTEIFKKAVNYLLAEDKLRTVLSVRKGKTLVLRILPHTDVSCPLAERLITVLPIAAMRDSDQALLRALPSIRHYLATANLTSLNQFKSHLQPHLSTLLENKLGISVIANMLERAETLISSGETSNEESEKWLEFLASVVSTSCEVPAVERPVVGIQGAVLARHLSRLPSTSNVSILLKALSNSVST